MYKPGRFSKILIAGIVTANATFTIAVLYIFLVAGSEPVTLIGCWFAFTTGELWMLSSIKKSKVKKEVFIDGNKLETKIDKS